MGSHYAYMAIMAALFYRTKTGKGQYIDSSIHDACALTTEMHINNLYLHRQRGQAADRPSRRGGAGDPSQLLCGDGKYVNAAATRLTPRQLRTMAEWMDNYGLAEDLLDERYMDAANINEHRTYINDLVIKFVATLSQEEVAHGARNGGSTGARCARQTSWSKMVT